ncbi:putative recombinase [Amycolatopsis taiwanensis]|uniref:Recombinase n=1 Tax=Amycolatopsis taiwanensis TaxID=342230 RepID=A0A9W6VHP5_9PSEU|nr:putative recombinase [Amycolatopsis taiwanensis]
MSGGESNPPAPAVEARVGRRGLSDLAVSPFGLPLALHAKEVRVAWVGRTSTEEHQDPRQSLLRQLERSKVALPESWVIVCHFYDVESGRMELDRRGRGTDYERFDIPIARDGGIADLLAEAANPARRFDVVICESMSRIARKMFETLSVERELERAGVGVFASNEPILLTGGRAQQILQRRINQSVAEYEVLNMLEQSWGGTCTHVREGYNIGKPCYGYKAKKYRHPNPVKAEKGLTKTRLEPDGARAETVTLIAKWRYHEQLGFDTIAERLNADLEAHPPPEPPGGRRARGAWSKSSVADVLKNPKYTGYQVYNRRARRSRGGVGVYNPPEMWVWSVEPAHEPLIPKWMFDELNAASRARRGSRDGSEQNRHPNTKRAYVLRSRVFCRCGRRMLGHHHRGYNYYRCWPKNNNRGRMDRFGDHPSTVYIREDALLTAITTAFADCLFGHNRMRVLTAGLDQVDDREERERQDCRARLQKNVADLKRKQDNLLRQAEDADPDDPFTAGLRERYNALRAQQQQLETQIAELDRRQVQVPSAPTARELAIVDLLPHLAVNLHRVPQDLQARLYELTRLRVQVDHETDHALIQINLPADAVDELAAVAQAARPANSQPDRLEEAANPRPSVGVIAVRAPGEIRTHTGRVLNPLPLPVGLRGPVSGPTLRARA